MKLQHNLQHHYKPLILKYRVIAESASGLLRHVFFSIMAESIVQQICFIKKNKSNTDCTNRHMK